MDHIEAATQAIADEHDCGRVDGACKAWEFGEPCLCARFARVAADAMRVAQLRDLTETLLDNDPEYTVADGGVTVLMVWRQDAARILGRS